MVGQSNGEMLGFFFVMRYRDEDNPISKRRSTYDRTRFAISMGGTSSKQSFDTKVTAGPTHKQR